MFEIEDYINQFNKLPEPGAKQFWVREFDRMIVHTREKLPEELIGQRRPYEPEDIQKYRLDSYEPITKSVINRAIQSLQRVFKTGTVDIKMSDDLKEYVSSSNFKDADLFTYINRYVIRRMIEDPNGLLVWWPVFSKDDIGASDSQEIKPVLVQSSKIIHLYNDVCTFESNEKSWVTIKDGDKQREVREGTVYYICTSDWYYKYIQVGKKSDNDFELREVYKHDLGYLPVIILGGDESTQELDNEEEVSYFVSYFSAFIAWGNEAIRQFSDNQGVKTVSGFPIREMRKEMCTDCKGRGRKKTSIENKPAEVVCVTCDGKGYRIPSSPYGVILTDDPDTLTNDNPADKPAIRYHNPDPAILKFMNEDFSSNMREAEKSLSILFVEDSQSGLAKEIDREQLYAQLDQIGLNLYGNIYKKSLDIIAGIRSINMEREVVIVIPNSFKSKTEHELIQELADLKEKNAPSFIVSEVAMELYKKRFATDALSLKRMRLVALVDPYYYYDQKEKSMLYASSAISEEEYRTSTRAPQVVLIKAEEDKDRFMETELSVLHDEIKEQLALPVQRPPIMP